MHPINYIIAFTSDMDRSVAFYRDVIGLPLRFTSSGWSEFDTGQTTFALHQSSEDAVARPAQAAGQCHPGLMVPDLAEFHKRMLSHGVTSLQAPKEEGNFGQLAIYADPDGLPISVLQPSGNWS